MNIRIGTGFDVHAFSEGRKLVLGGVEITSEIGLAGHSDADVLTHAVIDSLLGAAAMGDIGRHFPDDDDEYEGVSSLKLLAAVNKKIKAEGYDIGNIDTTIIAQAPKIAPYAKAMREALALVLGISSDKVSVKGTTTEHLGFTGRKEGIAAQAVALIVKNDIHETEKQTKEKL